MKNEKKKKTVPGTHSPGAIVLIEHYKVWHPETNSQSAGKFLLFLLLSDDISLH